MVRREAPPVLRAILGAAQLAPGPRELPVSGGGLKSFTAAAPFLLLLPSVLAKQRNRGSGGVSAGAGPGSTPEDACHQKENTLPGRVILLYSKVHLAQVLLGSPGIGHMRIKVDLCR